MRSFVLVAVCLFVFSVHGQTDEVDKEGNETPPKATTSRPVSTTPEPVPINPCSKCEELAERSKQEFIDFKYFKLWEKDYNSSWPKHFEVMAGEKYCEEFRWAYQCFQHCVKDVPDGAQYSYPSGFKHMEKILTKYCEGTWTDGKSCRMADTRACDMKHNRRLCGDHLKNYKECVEEVLGKGNQDCSGVCTPARRFHKVYLYQWDIECRLRQAIDGRCVDYVQLYCFGPLKDTDLSWGIFEEFNRDYNSSQLENTCPLLEEPIQCLQSTVDDWLMYFGFNVTRPCESVLSDVTYLQDVWSETINPLCAGRDQGLTEIQALCGEQPTTVRIPSTTTTTTQPTTPRPKKKIKRVRKVRVGGASNQLAATAALLVGSALLAVLL